MSDVEEKDRERAHQMLMNVQGSEDRFRSWDVERVAVEVAAVRFEERAAIQAECETSHLEAEERGRSESADERAKLQARVMELEEALKHASEVLRDRDRTTRRRPQWAHDLAAVVEAALAASGVGR